MTERPISPVIKQVLELGPTLVFFALYMWIKDDSFVFGGTTYSGFIVAALIFVPVLLVSMGILWALTGSLSRMQLFTAFMVVFFGGLTAWFNDPRFFKMKTTLVYGSMATILGFGLLRGQSYLEWVMGQALPMRREGWMILTRRLALMFVGLAIANEIIWRTQSDAVWVTLETFAFPAVLFAFLMAQILMLQGLMIDPDAPQDGDGTPPKD